MKRFWLVISFVLLLSALFCSCGPESDPADTGHATSTEGPPETSAVGDRTVTIDGMTFLLTEGEAGLVRYQGNGGTLEVPASVEDLPLTSISPFVFSFNEALEQIVLPGTVRTVPEWLFLGCSSLRTVTLGEGTEILGKGCFDGCGALAAVNAPSSLKVIGEAAFLGCASLQEFSIPASVTEIGYKAFAESGLRSAVIPSGCLDLGNGLFAGCESLTSAEILAEITTLPIGTFSQCFSLQSVTLPDSIETIDEEAFFRCSSLEEFRFPLRLISANPRCFYGCSSMKRIYIPGTDFKNADSMSFHYMPELTDVYYAGTEEQWNGVTINSLSDSLAQATIHFGVSDPAD